MSLGVDHGIYPKWRGLCIVPSCHAIEKMAAIGMQLYDIANLLEYGQPCLDEKRKDDTHTICEKWAKRTLKIVVSKDYSQTVNDEAWILVTVIEKR
ncbi:hypothetical protein [Methanobacterium formicicum]|uniref:hypothetical protein n=1 Tax=Methanobacterium formicicum TaxID=2162 RepID=UPI00249150B2|nr:hypothetical protein [Methanobacterium formicicum]